MNTNEVKEMIEAGTEMDESELREAFAAVYGRQPDAQDERDGLYSLIVAGVDENVRD